MSVQDNSLITLAYFKEVMGIDNSTNDTVYEHMINAVADWLDRYLGRSLKYAAYADEVYNGSGINIVNVRNYPLVAVTRVQHRSGFGSDAEWTSLDSNAYEVDKRDGQIVVAGRFHRGEVDYRISYTGGYSDDEPTAQDIPEDLKLACAQLVYNIFTNRKVNKNISSESLKNYSVSFVGKFVTDEFREIFGLYKTIRV